jgi:hypothetical protein
LWRRSISGAEVADRKANDENTDVKGKKNAGKAGEEEADSDADETEGGKYRVVHSAEDWEYEQWKAEEIRGLNDGDVNTIMRWSGM